MPGEEVRSARFCVRGPDECDGIAEPEEDGEVTFWKCARCGQEFGYEVTGSGDPDCQLGVPEAVRRLHGSSVMLAPGSPLPGGAGATTPGTVFIGPVIKRRAE